jgi:hypothetical protein
MDFTFTSTEETAAGRTPFYEDARADFAPYYASGKSVKVAKQEVAAELGKLGGVVIAFREGYFGEGRGKRYGYEIDFLLHDRRGVLRVAGLPMRRETPAKTEQVRVQALLNVRDQLKVDVTRPVFQPMAGHPLLMHLLVDGRRTVPEYIAQRGRLPELAAGEVVEGEFSEQ